MAVATEPRHERSRVDSRGRRLRITVRSWISCTCHDAVICLEPCTGSGRGRPARGVPNPHESWGGALPAVLRTLAKRKPRHASPNHGIQETLRLALLDRANRGRDLLTPSVD